MNTSSEIVPQSQFHDKLILDRQTTEKLGVVEQFWVDPRSHHVQGMISKSGFFNRSKQYFLWESLTSLGKDSVLVKSASPDQKLEKPAKAALIVGHEVWTDEGTKVGKISDFLFNLETGEILGYLFVNEGWKNSVLGGTYLLEPVAISSIGEKRMIVFAAAVENAEKYQEGMGKTWLKFLQSDYEKTREEVSSVVEQTWSKTQDAVNQVKDVIPQQADPKQEEKVHNPETEKKKQEEGSE